MPRLNLSRHRLPNDFLDIYEEEPGLVRESRRHALNEFLFGHWGKF